MAIPSFDAFFRPFLELLARDGVLHMRVVQERLQQQSGLTQEELAQRLPSGKWTVVENRTGWARTYLYKAGLIERVARGTYGLTAAGREFLGRHPERIKLRDLKTIPALRDWLQSGDQDEAEPENGSIPAEVSMPTNDGMEQSERLLRRLVEDELRARIAGMDPARFEYLVEQLVVQLGYGSSRSEVATALRRGGSDGGVDGVINEDRLGLGQIYLQAKRWADGNTVGRPTIQSFVGAMHGRAQKGVFITTSDFSREAREYAESLHGLRLRLIDGKELAGLMVDCGLGVSEERVYRTYRIDSDFFEDAE
jgi:restriction system protein